MAGIAADLVIKESDTRVQRGFQLEGHIPARWGAAMGRGERHADGMADGHAGNAWPLKRGVASQRIIVATEAGAAFGVETAVERGLDLGFTGPAEVGVDGHARVAGGLVEIIGLVTLDAVGAAFERAAEQGVVLGEGVGVPGGIRIVAGEASDLAVGQGPIGRDLHGRGRGDFDRVGEQGVGAMAQGAVGDAGGLGGQWGRRGVHGQLDRGSAIGMGSRLGDRDPDSAGGQAKEDHVDEDEEFF